MQNKLTIILTLKDPRATTGPNSLDIGTVEALIFRFKKGAFPFPEFANSVSGMG